MTTRSMKLKVPVESATVVINSLAQKKISSNIRVFNLSAGEPKLPSHEIINQAVVEALHQGRVLYPPVSGIPELKSLVTEWMNNTYDCNYQAENCLIVNGGKFGIYLLLQLLLQEGDEVIISSPYWVSYPAITKLFDGIPIIIETQESEEWKFTADSLKKICSPRTKILILNNGTNPTGTLYSRQELEQILKVAKEHNLLVISDEVYSGLIYDTNKPYISAGSFPEYQDDVIVIQSCSKNFSMTGWRIGFVFGIKHIIANLISLVSQSTSGVTTISQWAAVAAFKHSTQINDWVRKEMQKRRDILIKSLARHFGIKIKPPASALYVFISLNELGVSNQNSAEFCEQVLEEANVAIVPGKAFGKEGYVRLSFGAEEEDLELGVEALARYLHTF